jgi:hypothetical protein
MRHCLPCFAALLVVVATACTSTTSTPPTQPSATSAPAAATSAPTPASAAKPTAATTTGAATATPNVPPQATAAPAVATTAAKPAATAAAAVPATREAAATLPAAAAAVPATREAAATLPATAAAVPATREAAATLPAAQATESRPTAAAANKPSATISVKGAYSQASSVQGAVYTAREKGFFNRHGLDVQLSQIGGIQQVAALLSGELQFGALGANEVANADLRGADLVMIATCSDLPIFSLYANKKYTSVPELAGQSIGVTTAGSATDAAAHLFLRQFDVLDKVKILPAGGTVPAILAAMDQGNIAGGILSPPTTSRAEDAGYAELVNGARLGVPMNHSGIAVSRSYLKDHMEEVKNFLTAYQEAWTYVADPANKSDVVAILAQYTQSDNRLAEISYQAMAPIWTGNKTPRVNPQAVSNLLQVSGVPEAASANPDQFFDDSLIDSVAPPA